MKLCVMRKKIFSKKRIGRLNFFCLFSYVQCIMMLHHNHIYFSIKWEIKVKFKLKTCLTQFFFHKQLYFCKLLELHTCLKWKCCQFVVTATHLLKRERKNYEMIWTKIRKKHWMRAAFFQQTEVISTNDVYVHVVFSTCTSFSSINERAQEY